MYHSKLRKQVHLPSEMCNFEVADTIGAAITSFLIDRKIDVDVAKEYCKEISYGHLGRYYSGLAFRNESSGYEIISPFISQCYGDKDLSIIRMKGAAQCLIFENFMDFLSYKTLHARGKTKLTGTCIVLNAHKAGSRAVAIISPYSKICILCSNTAAGRAITQKLASMFTNRVFDYSNLYQGYETISDMLIGKPRL